MSFFAHQKRRAIAMVVIAAAVALLPLGLVRAAASAQRLYVFDCGTLHIGDMKRFALTAEEAGSTDLAMGCYLIVHAKGTLMWDTGAVPDADWQATDKPVNYHLVLPDGQTRDVTLRRKLDAQLERIGYPPSAITYLALSHYHYDHTGNAGEFSHSTWLVRAADRDPMFAPTPAATTNLPSYAALKDAKTVLIETPDYDVFGDGSVVIKSAPGHTPGHQVLAVRLAHTGLVLLSGDLYHFQNERQLKRVPTFESDPTQTQASRAQIEAYLKSSGAQLWIQHDYVSDAKLRKSPQFYD